MDDQIERNLQISLNHSLTGDADSNFTGDQRGSFPPGQLIDTRFRIIRELGRGGTGTVYQVEQILLKRQYAMKILDPIHVSDESWRRFQKEAQAAGRLDHAGFVKVHDFGLIDGQIPYLTMDLVNGDTLAQRLRKQGPMTVAQALPIFIQLCFALDYAHSMGVIHRDVKPSNICLTDSGTADGVHVKILDFGIAKLVGVDTASLTKVGSVFGTPFYMSPEQCMGQPVDLRCDIYSLGCVFFELLSGAPPFTTENALSLMMQHQSETPPSLKEVSMGSQFPAALETLIEKMLSKKPDDRYQRLIDTANDLIEIQQGKAPSIAVAKRAVSQSNRSNLIPILCVVGVSLMLLAFAGWYLTQLRNPEANKPIVKTTSQPTSELQPDTIGLTTDDRTNKSGIYDALNSTGLYFSTPIKKGVINYRVFKFPEKAPIGEFTYTDLLSNQRLTVPAVGEITIACNPPHPFLDLKIDWTMCSSSPQLLKKFRADEVGALSFTENDARRGLADDDIFDNALTFVDDLKSIYAIVLPATVTDASLEHLAKLPNLKGLAVAGTKITGPALRKLPILPHLRVLKMSAIKDASAVLSALKHSKTLKILNANLDHLQNSDLKNLANIASLSILVLRGNPEISDQGLTYLSELPNLKRLLLDDCNITPESISHLKKLKIREFVSLNLSQWSKTDVAALLNAVPYDVKTWNKSKQRYDSLRHLPDGLDSSEQTNDQTKQMKGMLDLGE